MTETEAFIALNMIPKLGPIKVRRLLDAIESPAHILCAKESDLRKVDGVGEEVAASIRRWESQVDLAGELKLIEEFGARVLTMRSPEYPSALREIHDPPVVLYILGALQDRDRHAVGVVGTRKPSHYGAECAKKLSYQLANSGITIVSGLARGVVGEPPREHVALDEVLLDHVGEDGDFAHHGEGVEAEAHEAVAGGGAEVVRGVEDDAKGLARDRYRGVAQSHGLHSGGARGCARAVGHPEGFREELVRRGLGRGEARVARAGRREAEVPRDPGVRRARVEAGGEVLGGGAQGELAIILFLV